MSEVITFDTFEPGTVMGESVVRYDEASAGRWQAIFGGTTDAGAGGAAEAAGMAVAMMMRGYLNVVTPRPPGNVHARQQFSLHNLPHAGEAICTTVSCVHKELRRERRYVELEAIGTGTGGRPIYTGRMTLIWAA